MSELDGGTKPMDVYLEECVKMWDVVFENTGASKIAPLFEPIEVNKEDNVHLRMALIAKGLHSLKCKYCGVNGCILPWEVRPITCKEYRCQKWEDDEH